jgi:transmembrane sensor
MSAVTDKSTDAIVDEAAEWIVRLSADDVPQEDLRAFVAWLKRSPVHVREYLGLETTWITLGTIDPSKRIDIEALLASADANVVELNPQVGAGRDNADCFARARSAPGAGHAQLRVDADPIAAHHESGPAQQALAMHRVAERTPQHNSLATDRGPDDRSGPGARMPTRSRRLAIVLTACLALVTAGIGFFNWHFANRYATGVGEQRTLKLTDGSTVVLNTGTTLRLNFTSKLREVQLLHGEALFHVAKDEARPFRVLSDQVVAQAVGTSFVVRKMPQQTLVTVIEGKVAIADSTQMDRATPTSVPRKAVVVTAGERADVAGQNVRTEAVANTAAVTAWRTGRLIFDGQPLSEVVNEFNRYNDIQIVLDDPQLSAERISGVFDADQPRSLVRFLEASGSIESMQPSPDTIYLQPRR